MIAMTIPNADAAEVFKTSGGNLAITHLGHGSLELTYKDKVIQVDPYSAVIDYAKRPKPDLILITHDHYDHLDKKALNQIGTDGIPIVASPAAAAQLTSNTIALRNGQTTERAGITVEAIPAYNVKHNKPDGTPFHPKGVGNGYVLTFADKTLYIAGDTEDIPEMNELKGKIDVAFLPKNMPYTMDDEMFVHAAKMIAPKVVYPYHYSELNTETLRKKLEGTGIELRTAKPSGKN